MGVFCGVVTVEPTEGFGSCSQERNMKIATLSAKKTVSTNKKTAMIASPSMRFCVFLGVGDWFTLLRSFRFFSLLKLYHKIPLVARRFEKDFEKVF